MSDKNFLVKSDEISNKKYGLYPGARPINELIKNGLLILDKWQGPTSREIVSTAKKILEIDLAGHSGTLDPMVSGVLPITLSNACKAIPALQRLDKEYVGVMRLHCEIDNEKLDNAIRKFTGEIMQRPPVRSAVARVERKRNVYNFEIIEISGRDVLFRVSCQAGTYIRKLVDSVGRETGGAHMTELRRTKVGKFYETVKIQDLADAYTLWKENNDEKLREMILPVEACADHLKKIIIKDSAVFAVAHGSPLYTGGICKIEKTIQDNELIALFTLKGELVALANAAMNPEDMMKRTGIAAKTDRVIIDSNIYPKR